MNIHQFNLQFNREQDRIIFRLNTTDYQEFRFALTRRFVKVLWPVLMQLLDNDLKRRSPEQAHVAKEIVNFEREQVISKANFSQQYAETPNKTYPLGEEYILLFGIKVKPGQQGDILCLHNHEGKGIEFMVNNAFLHPFCKLLEDAVRKAEWDLNLSQIGTQQKQAAPVQPRVLH